MLPGKRVPIGSSWTIWVRPEVPPGGMRFCKISVSSGPHGIPSAGLSPSSWLRWPSSLFHESWSCPHEEPQAEVKQQRHVQLDSEGHVSKAIAQGQSSQAEHCGRNQRDTGTDWKGAMTRGLSRLWWLLTRWHVGTSLGSLTQGLCPFSVVGDSGWVAPSTYPGTLRISF